MADTGLLNLRIQTKPYQHCSLNVYETNVEPPHPSAHLNGVIYLYVTLRHQVVLRDYQDEEILLNDVTSSHSATFTMPLFFLLPEYSEVYITSMLLGFNVDGKTCECLSPVIARYAVAVARNRGLGTVVEVEITNCDYIDEREIDKDMWFQKEPDQGAIGILEWDYIRERKVFEE
ncbi:hypothetical protein SLA2020_483720 [Shorea laevis]